MNWFEKSRFKERKGLVWICSLLRFNSENFHVWFYSWSFQHHVFFMQMSFSFLQSIKFFGNSLDLGMLRRFHLGVLQYSRELTLVQRAQKFLCPCLTLNSFGATHRAL